MFDDLINKIESRSLSKILKKKSDFPFTGVETEIKNILEIAKSLKNNRAAKFLPASQVQTISTALTNINNTLDQIEAFNPPTDPNPGPNRDALINQLRVYYQDLFGSAFQILAFDEASKLDTSDLEEEISKVKSVGAEAERTLGDVKKVEGDVKKAAGVTGAAKFAEVFGNQANQHRGLAAVWLVITVLVISQVARYLLQLSDNLSRVINNQQTGLSVSQQAQAILANLVLVPLVYYVVYQCIKNYNAQMNLLVLNRHRENSLRTFESLRDSGTDNQTKNTVLVQASKSIFYSGDSGYLKANNSGGDDIDMIKVIERFTER